MARIIDLSQLIENMMPVYPGDSETSLVQTKFLEEDYHNNHLLQIGMHSGTHIDSPMHLTPSKVFISEWPLESFMGPGSVLDVRDKAVISMSAEYEESVQEDSILLLCTGHDRLYGTKGYYEEFPVVDDDFCDMVIRKNVKMLGMDSPSPDIFPFPVHKKLMKNGVFILENLTNLDQLLSVASFEVIAFPLKIKADGAMTRAVARVCQ